MFRIMFICHGNICRSPMAEFVMKDLVDKKGLADVFTIASSATSTEELGNPVHRGTKKKLAEHGISTAGKVAVQLRRQDYDLYDYLIGMDSRNIINTVRIIGNDPKHKVGRLLEFAGIARDIEDPWYTGDFEQTYQDVLLGCEALLKRILQEQDTSA